MTSLTLNGSTRPALQSIWSSFVSGFSEARKGAREGREIEARYHELSRLSRPDLNRLGMERSDIYRAALRGRPV